MTHWDFLWIKLLNMQRFKLTSFNWKHMFHCPYVQKNLKIQESNNMVLKKKKKDNVFEIVRKLLQFSYLFANQHPLNSIISNINTLNHPKMWLGRTIASLLIQPPTQSWPTIRAKSGCCWAESRPAFQTALSVGTGSPRFPADGFLKTTEAAW